jgi:hypothetical protein
VLKRDYTTRRNGKATADQIPAIKPPSTAISCPVT